MSLATTTHPVGRLTRRVLFIGGEVRPVSRRLAVLLLALPAAGALLDSLTFMHMINVLGIEAEQHPLAVWLITNFGLLSMFAVKGLTVFVAWRICMLMAKRQPGLAIATAVILHDLGLFGALTNILSAPITLPF